MKQFAFLLLSLLSTACTVTPSKQDQVTDYLNNGDYEKAYNSVESYFRYNLAQANDYAKMFIVDHPESLTYITNYYISKINNKSDASVFTTYIDRIQSAHNYNLLSDADYQQLIDLLNETATTRNKSNSISFLVIDGYEKIPSLTDEENSLIIYKRSVDKLTESYSKSLFIKIIETTSESGIGSEKYDYLKSSLPNIQIPKQMLNGKFKELFPDIAKSRLDMFTVRLHLSAPSDESEYLFGVEEILEKSEFILLTDEPCQDCFVVYLDKIRFSERELPERSQTVSYNKYDVNIVEAVLLMPDYSTYQYEIHSGGYSISYTFNIELQKDGRNTLKKTIKGKEVDEYSYCNNQSIHNAFGGVIPAGFTANADMAAKCSSSKQDADPDKVYKMVMEKVADEILALPPISNRINYGIQ